MRWPEAPGNDVDRSRRSQSRRVTVNMALGLQSGRSDSASPRSQGDSHVEHYCYAREMNLQFTGGLYREPEFDDGAGDVVEGCVVSSCVLAQAGERLVDADALASGDHALRLFNDDA